MELNIFDVDKWKGKKEIKLVATVTQMQVFVSSPKSYQQIFDDVNDCDIESVKSYITTLMTKFRHSDEELSRIIQTDALQLSTVLVVSLQYMPAVDIIINNIVDYAQKNGVITRHEIIKFFDKSVPSDTFYKPDFKPEYQEDEFAEIEPDLED